MVIKSTHNKDKIISTHCKLIHDFILHIIDVISSQLALIDKTMQTVGEV